MGLYINPEGQTKEDFLREHGEGTAFDTKFEDIPKGFLAVCLVDNGPFKAAGVCFDEAEFKVFTSPSDVRPRSLYLVKTEEVKKVTGDDFSLYVKETE